MQATIILFCITACLTFCHVDESDYESSSGELTFAASFGNLSRVGDSECVDIVIVNDDINEFYESFVFVLCTGGNYFVEISERETNIYIYDEDSKSDFMFNISDDFCSTCFSQQ